MWDQLLVPLPKRHGVVIQGRCGSSFAQRAAAVIGAVTLLAGCTSPALGSASPPTPTRASAQATVATKVVLPATPVDATTIDTLGFLTSSRQPDRVWAGSPDGLVWIDPATNEVHRVDDKPGVYLSVDGAHLYRAAFDYDNVAKYSIAGEPREVSRVRVSSPLNINAGRDRLWVTNHGIARLSRLDPETLASLGSSSVGSGEGVGPAGLDWVGDHLWVTSGRDRSLYEIDGDSGRIVHRLRLEGTPADDFTVSQEGIWMVQIPDRGSPEIVLVDPGGRRTTAVLSDLCEVEAVASCLPILVEGEVWVPVEGYLVHLDRTHQWRPDRAVGLPDREFETRFATVAFGSVWLSGPFGPLLKVPVAQLK